MKADRLLSILMLLQIHHQLTAHQLAKRLEVSVRTIYRDIDALSRMGIPIFTHIGANGGVKLLGDYKTTLTGLTKDELYSLFMPTGDKILADLGIEKIKDSTLLKLLGESSTQQINDIKNLQQYIYIDLYTWKDTHTTVDKEVISTLQTSIWNQRVVTFNYHKPNETKTVTLSPLGLVCKRGMWYLVGKHHEIIKTYKVSLIQDANTTDSVFTRPADFNLEHHWKNSVASFTQSIPTYPFTFKVDPTILEHIKQRPFIKIMHTRPTEDGIYLDVSFDALFLGIEFAFGYGNNIEIIHPPEAIDELKQKAAQIVKIYADSFH